MPPLPGVLFNTSCKEETEHVTGISLKNSKSRTIPVAKPDEGHQHLDAEKHAAI
jgi:hypothetical protein